MANEGMERWKGRVALVTGASSGIGEAIALELSAAGMDVVAWARRQDRLQQLVKHARDRGTKVTARVVDMRDEQAIVDGFDALRRSHGGVDVLINNAGLGHKAPLLDGPAELWREMLEVNVLALCLCTQQAVADMRRRGDDGHVVHISSMAAHRVPAGGGVYSASKFAVRALTEGLRQELRAARSNIRVSAISPGFVETEFAEKYHRSSSAETYGRFKVLESEDVVSAVRYVLSVPPHVQVHDLLVRPTAQAT